MRLPPCLKLATSLVLALGSASAFAGTVSVDTDTATAGIQANGTINTGGTRDVNLVFNPTGNEVVTSTSGNPGLQYDTAVFNVSSNNGTCVVNDGTGSVSFIAFEIDGLDANEVLCTLTFTDVSNAAGVEALTLSGVQPMGTVTENGQLTISAVVLPPPTINFSPTTVNIPAGGAPGATSAASVISVTATGGTAPATGSYDCGAAPAGFQVTNLANPSITAGTDPADMSVTCTLTNAAQQGTLTCNRTGGAVTPVAIQLNCPAGQVTAPAFTATPANGTALNCSGSPGQITTTQVSITNSGNAAATGVSCNTVGGGFAIQTQPTATINAGASSTVVVSCTVPAEGVTNSGTLNCTSANGAGPLAYPLSATGQTGAVPTAPATIPSTSLWAKIGLIGLLAALGALVVGFRRHS